jgi:hypothetical protein
VREEGSVTVTSADLSQWAAHRRAVVFTVSRRVPGIDPELAASRGLELLCVELIKHGNVADPVTFWSTAAVDAALEMAHEEPSPEEQTSQGEAMTAPVRRALDFEVLSTAMERLPAGEQQILWDHHVGSRPVAAIADEIGVLPYAAKRRLRRAESRLASSFAETHTGIADDAECKATRASMHDFVRNRLLPRRRQQVEDHMVQCAGCTRAFVDVRESFWMLRAAAPVLLLGAATVAKTSTAAAAAGAGAAASAGVGGWLATLGTRAVLTVRSALTDPVGLAATVVGGLFITTAVTTGVAGGAGAVPSFPDSGMVSVSRPDAAVKAGVRNTMPASPKVDPTNIPEPPASDPTTFVPPGLAGTGGTPPGLAKKDGVPPGLAEKDGVPPGQAEKVPGPDEATKPGTTVPGEATTDDKPPGKAKKEGVPPGKAKKDGTPPGQAKGTPPGQAKKETTPPGQAKKDDTPPGQAKREAPPGQAKREAPPGQAKKNQVPDGQGREPAWSGALHQDEHLVVRGLGEHVEQTCPDRAQRRHGSEVLGERGRVAARVQDVVDPRGFQPVGEVRADAPPGRVDDHHLG